MQHGTARNYNVGKCRCEACRAAKSTYRRTTPRRLVVPTSLREPADLHWFAGFYEGEGSVTNNRRGNGFALRIPQVDPEPIAKLHSLFGGAVSRKRTASGRGCYEWRLGSKAGRALAIEVLPLLSSRRRRQVQALLPTRTIRHYEVINA